MNVRAIGVWCVCAALAALGPAAPAGAAVIADYQGDFQGTSFPAGWQYLWNAPDGWDGSSTPAGQGNTGPISDPSGYAALQWSGTGWTVDGDNDSSNGSPGRYLRLHGTGGHPGRGSGQGEGGVGNTLDRYAIAAYTIQPGQAGLYSVTNTFADPIDGNGNGGDVIVRVNSNAPASHTYFDNSSVPFNTFVGPLSAGDTVYVALGPNVQDGNDNFNWDFSLDRVSSKVYESTQDVAGYRADFQGTTFPTGWAYQVSTSGPVGAPASYDDLLWVAADGRWDVDGNPGLPGPDPGAWANLSATGGHPGRGSGQGGAGNTLDRYVVASFVIPEDGDYMLTNSFIDPQDTAGNGGDVLVHVNDDAPLLQRFFDDAPTAFDTFLGSLSAGDVVYVAVGPNGQDGNDGFAWDFTVTRLIVPEPCSLALASLAACGLGAYMRRRRRIA